MSCESRVAMAVVRAQFPAKGTSAIGSWYQMTGEESRLEDLSTCSSGLQTVRIGDSARVKCN
jgi:hypothetical protein